MEMGVSVCVFVCMCAYVYGCMYVVNACIGGVYAYMDVASV